MVFIYIQSLIPGLEYQKFYGLINRATFALFIYEIWYRNKVTPANCFWIHEATSNSLCNIYFANQEKFNFRDR